MSTQTIERAVSAGSETGTERRFPVLHAVWSVVLLAGWAAVTLPDPGVRALIVNSGVFAVLGAYSFCAAALLRRTSLRVERKLRLDLLVRNMELETAATRDDLTQLFNRRYFFERLQREIESARGFSRPLSLILIDLDGFAAVNEAQGHRGGDNLLARFGSLLLAQTRASDIPARIGGDEFALLMPDTSESAAEIAVQRLRAALEVARPAEDGGLPAVSVSLGVSGFPWGAGDADELLRQAQASLRATKLSRERNGHAAEPEGETPIPAAFLKTDDQPADSDIESQ